MTMETIASAAATAPGTIRFTDRAAARVAALVAREGNPLLKLRVLVQGGGCSGFQYKFSFDAAVREGDVAIEHDGAALLVDAVSYPYLCGAEIDCEESLKGAQFVVRNPNAEATCGCGSSFSA